MREIVIIPQEHISWLIEQKDSDLSVVEIRKKNLAFEWLLPSVMDPVHDPIVFDLIRRKIPRNIGILHPAIMEEICNATNGSMSLESDGWRTVCLWQSMHNIIKAVGYRLLFNLPLCEDQGFLRSTETFSTWLGMGVIIAGQLVPWPLRPLVGSIFAIPVYLNRKIAFKSLLPVVEKRMEDIRLCRTGHLYKDIEPNDFTTWYCVAVLNSDIAEYAKTPEAIARRLLGLVSSSRYNLSHSR